MSNTTIDTISAIKGAISAGRIGTYEVAAHGREISGVLVSGNIWT